MIEYKESFYNVKKVHENNFIILNTLTGHFVKFDSELSNEVFNCLENINAYKNSKIKELLFKYGFIIKNDDSEEDILQSLITKIVDDKDELNLIIFPTEKCNFRCKYCYENFSSPSMEEENQQHIINFIEKNCKKYKKINVDWFGGEPLLCIDMIENLSKEIISICNRNKVLYIAGITTNGYNLSYENFLRLKRCKIYRYQITIDGLASMHDNQRVLPNGAGTWKKIIENLKDIRDKVKSGSFNITIRTNVTREIYNSFSEYLRFLKNEFGHDKRFKYLFRLAADWGNLNDKEIKSKFCSTNEYIEILKYSLEHNFFNVGVKNCLVPGGMLCYAWKNNTLIIRADGTIGKCTLNLYNDINQISHIDKYNIEEINEFWNFDKIGTPEKCKGCNKYPICLRVNCNMITNGDVECELEMEELNKV